jgi:hypothetical protein
MTLDETTLPSALRDLAASVPDDPSRLACLHRRAARAQRRRRAVGAGAIAATMAATVAGAEVLVVSSGHRSAPLAPAAAGPAAASKAPSPPVSPSAACADQPAPTSSPSVPLTPPSIGQSFSAGGEITAPGTATAVTVKVTGPPLDGSTLTLTVTPASKVFLSSPLPDGPEVAATSTQLQSGDGAKFTATRTGATSYSLDELHAGPASSGAPGSPGLKAGAGSTVPTPPPVGGPFKVAGVGVSSTADSVTVNVTRGNLTGVVTFTLSCRPPQNVAGQSVELAGTRTGPDTYAAQAFMVVSATP